MRVLVAGGGGFLGGAIVRALQAADIETIAVSRHPAPGVLSCDAADPAQLASAMQGVDAVVNAVLADGGTMRKATENLAAVAVRRQVPLVHISSAAVYGDAAGRVTETAPLPRGVGYAAAKRDCEALVRASRVASCILRPGIVYGPGSTAWVLRIGCLLRAGRLGDLGPAGDGRCNLVLARDVAAAVVTALQQNIIRGDACNLGTPEPPRWNEFFALFARAIGAGPLPRIGRARLCAEWLAAPVLALGRRARLPPPLSPQLQRLFRQELILDTAKAAAFCFPATPIAAGIAESAAWFRGLPA